MWLSNLQFDFFDDENPNYLLPHISVGMGKDSMFYNDARRHMSRHTRKNIDNFDKTLNEYDKQIRSYNETINGRISEILGRPVFSRLTDVQSSNIYRILKIGFHQILRGQEEMETAITKWDFPSKVSSYGFTIENEAENAKSILAAILQDQTILDSVRAAYNEIVELKRQGDIIKGQSKEVSSLITNRRYRAKRLCCPSLIKEIWQNIF